MTHFSPFTDEIEVCVYLIWESALTLIYINLKNILNIFIYTTGGNCCVLLYLGFWDENKKVDKGKMDGKRDLILSGHGTAGAGACQ